MDIKRVFLRATGISLLTGLLLVGCGQPSGLPPTTPSPAGSGSKSVPLKETWQLQWENLVAEAKKEGKVNIASNWGPKPREAVIKALRERYGIDAEISSAGASQQGEKILTERRAGLYNYDVAVQGANFGINLMKPAGAFVPSDPVLVLPEVKEPRAWLGESFPLV